MDKNVIIFGVDSSSLHVENKKKDVLVLGGGPALGLDDTTEAEAKYSINFTALRKRFLLSLHYNRSNSFLVNATKNISIQSKRFKNKTISIVFR